MASKPDNITTIEMGYCWCTVVMALGLPLSMLLPVNLLAVLSQYLGVGLAILFPIGVIIAFIRPSGPIPRIVVMCIVLSGLWIGVLVKYNWR